MKEAPGFTHMSLMSVDPTDSKENLAGQQMDPSVHNQKENFHSKHFPLGLEGNMLLLENCRVRPAVPPGQLGAEEAFRQACPS